MKKRTLGASVVLTVALSCSALIPQAFADDTQTLETKAPSSLTELQPNSQTTIPLSGPTIVIEQQQNIASKLPLASRNVEETPDRHEVVKAEYEAKQREKAQQQALERTTKQLSYDPALIAAIGNQRSSGHSICCPGFACAYGDAIITGEAFDHSAYGCGSCTWPNWGGGGSSFRSLGSNEALLREAYDQIQLGKPTVIHVLGSYGQHWITLIGYHDVADPDNLTLSNFTALNPSDGAEINPADQYVLYGDFSEHISSR